MGRHMKATKYAVESNDWDAEGKDIPARQTIVNAKAINTDERGNLFIEDQKGVAWVFAQGEWARVRRLS